jgi:hypothetical protein
MHPLRLMDTDYTEHMDPDVDRMTNEGGPDFEARPSGNDEHSRFERMMTFARRHPGATVIGAAGIGLFGGLEIAAAVLIGAGVAALVRLPDRAPRTTDVRDRARSFVERVRDVVTRTGTEH